MHEKQTVMEVLLDSLSQSENKTTDLIVEHGELPGLKPEMLEWWFSKVSLYDNYKKWYPQDHISFVWQVPPDKGLAGAVTVVTESIGEFAASPLYIRPEDPPGWSSMSDEKGTRVAWIKDEVIGVTANGTTVRSVFRLPAKTPQKFLDAMRDHSKGEIKRFTEFLPQMYRDNSDRVVE